MPYVANYFTDLENIVQLVKKKEINGENGAVKKFEDYLNAVVNVGDYHEGGWNLDWRKKIYEFGELFKDSDPSLFFHVIERVRDNPDNKNRQVLEFIKSEIEWNYFEETNEYFLSTIKSLVKKFPDNPEFHHTYAHVLEMNGNFERAISENLFALKIEPHNKNFFVSGFNKIKQYIDFLIRDGKIDMAETKLSYFRDVFKFNSDPILNNVFIAVADRVKDHQLIDYRIGKMNDSISDYTEKERRVLIEVLGIFSAILGFTVISVNVALSNLNINDILFLMIQMAGVLLIFAITISFLFGRRNGDARFWSFLKEKRIHSIVIIFIFMSIIYFLKNN